MRFVESIAIALDHDWAQSIAILLLSVVVALAARVFITRVLLVLAGRTQTTLDDQVVKIMGGPVTASFVLVGIWYSSLNMRPPETLMASLRGILITGAVIYWCTSLLKVSKEVLTILSEQRGERLVIRPRTLPMFEFLANSVIIGGGLYFLFLAWNIDVTGWLASAGILGIAVGFGARDSLANLFAGVFIIADAPYKIGDYLILSSGDRGRVTDIGLRSTRMLTFDEVEVIVPNSVIGNSEVINQSGGPARLRVNLTVGVAYESDIDHVRAVLLELASSNQSVLEDPAPNVYFLEMADSALVFKLCVRIRYPELREHVIDALNTAIFKRFAQDGIQIPFPQQELRVQFNGNMTPGEAIATDSVSLR